MLVLMFALFFQASWNPIRLFGLVPTAQQRVAALWGANAKIDVRVVAGQSRHFIGCVWYDGTFIVAADGASLKEALGRVNRWFNGPLLHRLPRQYQCSSQEVKGQIRFYGVVSD